jgi:transposase InsO family protein/transposase-like protein
MMAMPAAYPEEFRKDVVRVARKGEAPLSQIAKDSGIAEGTLSNWLKRADIDDGTRTGVTTTEATELQRGEEAQQAPRAGERDTEEGGDLLRQASAPKMKYPLVLDLAGDGIPVTVTCRVLGFSPQAFNQWRRNPVSQRDWDNAHLINAAIDIHGDDPAFGYRFIADELKDAGHEVSERRLWRICSEQGIWSVFSKKRDLNRKAGPPVHDDLVDRDFTATRPNQLWLTDITEHRTNEGKLYLWAIKDVFSNRIVGYSIDDRMKASLAVSSLRNAIGLRHPMGSVTVHSDRGSQFRSKTYVRTLKHNGLTGSMGRVGACGDNAAMESFFALLQKNVLDRQRWETREELRVVIVSWIERTHHRRRRQRALGWLTPVEFELLEPVRQAA